MRTLYLGEMTPVLLSLKDGLDASIADRWSSLPSNELDNDLAWTVVVNFLEFSNVTWIKELVLSAITFAIFFMQKNVRKRLDTACLYAWYVGNIKGGGRGAVFGYHQVKIPKYNTVVTGYLAVKRKESLLSRTVLLHSLQELDNDLWAWSDQNLTLSSFFGIVDGVERIVENRCFNHFD